jgi:hypothetical protein
MPIANMCSREMIRMTLLGVTHFRYNGEFSTFIDAIEDPNPDTSSLILSTFDDAVKTYELTWKIREAAEKNARRAIAGMVTPAES